MGKAAIEPTALDTKQKAALRRLERVTGAASQSSQLQMKKNMKWKETDLDSLDSLDSERNL